MTQEDGGSPPSLPGFWAHARHHPDAVALVEEDGTTWTAGHLLARVDQLSHGLRAAGLGSGDTLAVAMANRPEYLVAVLAAAQVGLGHTLANSHLSAPELAHVLRDSGARLVLTDDDLAEVCGAACAEAGLPASAQYVVGAPRPGTGAWADLVDGQPATEPEDRSSGRPMLYTSGTSGRPKGVRLPPLAGPPEAGAVQASAVLLHRLGIDPAAEVGRGVHLVTSPLYHAAPIANVLLALHLGHTVVLMRRWDAAGALRLVEDHGVTWTHVVPTMLSRLMDLPDEVRTAARTSSLRWVIHAGAPCPTELKRAVIEWLGPIVYEYYSSTEAGGTAIGPEEWLAHPGSVGRAWPGADVRILDDEGRPVPPGQVGNIYLRNTKRFSYHNDPAKTAAATEGDYVTVGDMGRLDQDGYLYLADRRTDLIISGGVNIYPAEVEGALQGHPAVRDVAVVGVPHPEWGQQVTAVVELHDGAEGGEALAEDIRAHLDGRIARFKVPRSILFTDALPRTAAGKLQRRVVRDRLAGAEAPTATT